MAKKWKKYSTGLELVLCSCERDLLCVLTEDEELVFSLVWGLQDRASELLAPSLKQMFELSGRKISDLRRIGCVRGPGSFTGIRLVLATAAALRRTTRAQLAALDYMQSLATSLAMNEQLLFGRRIWIATHARRDLVHLAGYISYGPVIPAVCVEPVHLVSPEGACEKILAGLEGKPEDHAGGETGQVLLAGSALARHKEIFADLEARSAGRLATRTLLSPTIEALRLLGRHGDYFPQDVEPLYIRPCDAVDNLPELSRRMGQDADRATRELERLLHSEVRDLNAAREDRPD